MSQKQTPEDFQNVPTSIKSVECTKLTNSSMMENVHQEKSMNSEDVLKNKLAGFQNVPTYCPEATKQLSNLFTKSDAQHQITNTQIDPNVMPKVV